MAAGEVWEDLGFALYKRRIELGIETQGELARLSGVSRNRISLIERGLAVTRRGSSWSKLEVALKLPQGWISEFVSKHPARNARALSADAVERAVRDAIDEAAPQLTVRQARLIAKATVRRLAEDGLLGRPGA